MIDEQLAAKEAMITAICRDDLDEVAQFLHQHLNHQYSPEVWKQGINQSWLSDAPNFGFMLRCGPQLVGVLCAIYSQQNIAGRLERFCNPHSWCVLPEFRARSIDLVITLIRQKGYTYTMFSPNKDGIEIFKYLKFKPLDNQYLILLNTPFFMGGAGEVISAQDIEHAKMKLPKPALQCYQDHSELPWLNFVFFKDPQHYGFLIFKKHHHKRMGSAWIMYVSDADLFRRCWPAIRTHLLVKSGLITSKIETRLLDQPIKTWFKPVAGTQRFYRSEVLTAESIQNVYSELVTFN